MPENLPPIGIYPDIPVREYRNWKALSSTDIRTISNKSIADYFYNKENHKSDTNATAIGTALHCLILKPDKFNDEVLICADAKTRTAKAWIEFEKANPGKIILSQDDYQEVCEMGESFKSHPFSIETLNGKIEHSILALDRDTQLYIKARPDLVNDTILLDIKTTNDASPESFAKDIFNYGYHIQFAFYRYVIRCFDLKWFIKDCLILVFEKNPPYEKHIAIYRLSDDDLAVGSAIVQQTLRRYEKYQSEIRNNKTPWNGYPPGIQSIEIPQWAKLKSIKEINQ